IGDVAFKTDNHPVGFTVVGLAADAQVIVIPVQVPTTSSGGRAEALDQERVVGRKEGAEFKARLANGVRLALHVLTLRVEPSSGRELVAEEQVGRMPLK